jgi:N-acetylmuramoyl-L-alanine amidase
MPNLSRNLMAVAVAVVVAGAGAPAQADEPTNAPAGERRPLVVLDPGHGGTNAGAPTVHPQVYEKELTLALALELAGRLRARGIDVVLTRERDLYLTLRQRVARANELGADLFLSLHANATEAHAAHGFETFILSPEALEVDSRALRRGDGRPRVGLDRATAALLDDVERGVALEGAAALAAAVQRGLRRVRGAEGDRGVRQAAMDVLMGATMPAVLVEVGFADHPIEGHELFDPTVRSDISAALADAVAGQVDGAFEPR